MTPTYSYEDIAKMIDHSLLNPALSARDLAEGCQLARHYDVASVCVLPYFVREASALLAGSTVLPTTTVGFPHGGHVTAIKLAEAEQAISDGAKELDMVINISKAKSGDWDYVAREISAVTALAHGHEVKVKVIFENAYLDDTEKVQLCQICAAAGVDWIKTSTGYAAGGATLEDLHLMRKVAPPAVAVKAAGGIRDLDALLQVREIGVNRVGASATVGILEECRTRLGLSALSKNPAGPQPHESSVSY